MNYNRSLEKIARKRSENNLVEKLNIRKRSRFPGREENNFRRKVTIMGPSSYEYEREVTLITYHWRAGGLRYEGGGKSSTIDG